MSDEVPEQYRPRLCHVVKWQDFDGYGFNLHAEKGKSGQFVGKIDKNSPAEAAGLKDGDRIVEVNGVHIGHENHQQVVTRIKSGGEDTRLLVVDADADNWYTTNKLIIRGDLPEVRHLSSKREEVDISDHGRVNGGDKHENAENVHSDVEKTVVSVVSAPVYNGTAVNDDNFHRPRLCHLKFWPHFEGYGFNLHAEKEKPGQYIGLVDDNSPSSTGGLRVNDRIIEVNYVNIEKEKHAEVIAMIKAIPGETKLLVVDKATDMYYQSKKITVSSSMPQVDHIVTPDTTANPPATKRHHHYEEIKIGDVEASDGVDLDDEQAKGQVGEEEGISEGTNMDYEDEVKAALEHEVKAPLVVTHEEKSEDALHDLKSGALASSEHQHHITATSQVHQDSSATTAKAAENLELNLSVAEMKERLKSKKRQDPRMSKVPFEQKYKDFQRM